MATNPGLNILKDCTFTLIPGGADDGEFNAGSPVTFKADRVSVRNTKNLENHNTAQDDTPWYRTLGTDWECTIETKLKRNAAAGVEGVLNGNDLAGFTASQNQAAAGPLNLAAASGIISESEFNFAGPNTVRFVLKPYGDPLVGSIG